MLTAKQYHYYRYISAFIAIQGYAPLLREIAAHFRVTIPAACKQINALQRAGYITRGYWQRRSIQLVELEKSA